jgi:hypothetical protein
MIEWPPPKTLQKEASMSSVPGGRSNIFIGAGQTQLWTFTLGSAGWQGNILTRLLQSAAFSFRTIKYWSGFADNFWSATSKCSAKKLIIDRFCIA